MNKFDSRVLKVLYELYIFKARSYYTDNQICQYGQLHFFKDWAGKIKQSKTYPYVPALSLSLGRLQKLGLVESYQHPEDSFRKWRLSVSGAGLFDRLNNQLD